MANITALLLLASVALVGPVAWGEQPRQIAKARVLHHVARRVRHEQPHIVPAKSARFRRLAGFKPRRQLEVRDHACCSHRASSCCAAKRSPLIVCAG